MRIPIPTFFTSARNAIQAGICGIRSGNLSEPAEVVDTQSHAAAANQPAQQLSAPTAAGNAARAARRRIVRLFKSESVAPNAPIGSAESDSRPQADQQPVPNRQGDAGAGMPLMQAATTDAMLSNTVDNGPQAPDPVGANIFTKVPNELMLEVLENFDNNKSLTAFMATHKRVRELGLSELSKRLVEAADQVGTETINTAGGSRRLQMRDNVPKPTAIAKLAKIRDAAAALEAFPEQYAAVLTAVAKGLCRLDLTTWEIEFEELFEKLKKQTSDNKTPKWNDKEVASVLAALVTIPTTIRRVHKSKEKKIKQVLHKAQDLSSHYHAEVLVSFLEECQPADLGTDVRQVDTLYKQILTCSRSLDGSDRAEVLARLYKKMIASVGRRLLSEINSFSVVDRYRALVNEMLDELQDLDSAGKANVISQLRQLFLNLADNPLIQNQLFTAVHKVVNELDDKDKASVLGQLAIQFNAAAKPNNKIILAIFGSAAQLSNEYLADFIGVVDSGDNRQVVEFFEAILRGELGAPNDDERSVVVLREMAGRVRRLAISKSQPELYERSWEVIRTIQRQVAGLTRSADQNEISDILEREMNALLNFPDEPNAGHLPGDVVEHEGTASSATASGSQSSSMV